MKYIKYLVCILFVVVLGGGVILWAVNEERKNQPEELNHPNIAEIAAEQKEQIIDFFHQEKEGIAQIKDALWADPYASCWIGYDGYIQLGDDTSIWAPDISPKAKELMEKGKDYNAEAISYGKGYENTPEFQIETYFSDTAMVFNIVYTERDIATFPSSEWYEPIEGNWYLFAAGMN
ncbi:MAG: hypothetical protein KHW59_01490 [Clostridiales bacterium]|nr:hypothetical protein [Clostridiales bacterium]